MTIKQLNASYMIHEDRMLFRISTVDDAEYRFWLTRRVCLFILSATNHLYAKKLEEKLTPQASKAVIEFEQDAAKSGQVNEESKLPPATTLPANSYPIGVDPVLVMDVKCAMTKEGDQDLLLLDLLLPAGGVLNLKMAGQTLHAMCILLNQLREHAVWGDVPQVQAAQSAVSEEIKKADQANEPQKPLIH